MRKGLTAGIISIATAAAVIAGPTAAFASTGHDSTQTTKASVSVKDTSSVDHSGTTRDKIRDKRNSSGPDRNKDAGGSGSDRSK